MALPCLICFLCELGLYEPCFRSKVPWNRPERHLPALWVRESVLSRGVGFLHIVGFAFFAGFLFPILHQTLFFLSRPSPLIWHFAGVFPLSRVPSSYVIFDFEAVSLWLTLAHSCFSPLCRFPIVLRGFPRPQGPFLIPRASLDLLSSIRQLEIFVLHFISQLVLICYSRQPVDSLRGLVEVDSSPLSPLWPFRACSVPICLRKGFPILWRS